MTGKIEKTIFVCQSCGFQNPKWLGRCPDCGTWNSFVEETRPPSKTGPGHWNDLALTAETPQPLREISTQTEAAFSNRDPGAGPGPGRGVVPGSAVSDRGRSGNRKVHPPVTDPARSESRRVPHLVYFRGGISPSDQNARGTPGPRKQPGPDPGGNLLGSYSENPQGPPTPVSGH